MTSTAYLECLLLKEDMYVDVFEMVHSATVVDKADAAVCPQPNCRGHISTTYHELENSVNVVSNENYMYYSEFP